MLKSCVYFFYKYFCFRKGILSILILIFDLLNVLWSVFVFFQIPNFLHKFGTSRMIQEDLLRILKLGLWFTTTFLYKQDHYSVQSVQWIFYQISQRNANDIRVDKLSVIFLSLNIESRQCHADSRRFQPLGRQLWSRWTRTKLGSFNPDIFLRCQ